MRSLKQDRAVILIIDSDPLMLTGMAAVLHMKGFECHCAQSSEAALKAAATLELDLIICDVMVKQQSGLELCSQIREQDAEDVPVLYLSSTQHPDIIRRTHEAGGAYYLRKPFDPELLVELAGKALWLPHLVQSNLQARSEHQASASHIAPPIQISSADDAPNQTTQEQQQQEAHVHSAAPAPKSKPGKKGALSGTAEHQPHV